MILLTRRDEVEILVNENFIESATANPDTNIIMHNGRSLLVKEGLEDILHQIIAYQRAIKKRPRNDD